MKSILLALLVSFSQLAYCSSEEGELQGCLVRSTSEEDGIVLVRWIAKAINSHPDLKDMSNLNNEKGSEIDRRMADYLSRLIKSDCKKEFTAINNKDGGPGTEAAFAHLGSSAMRKLIANKLVNEASQSFLVFIK
jgi:hypothetical protein